MAGKKAQLISFDFATGIIVFIIIFLLFAGVVGVSLMKQKATAFDFETEYIFDNLENNLKFDNMDITHVPRDFFSLQRIDPVKLTAFADWHVHDATMDFDQFTVGQVRGAHGIGLDPSGFDTCLYFNDIDGKIMRLYTDGNPADDLYALGRLDKDMTNCNNQILAGHNPCVNDNQAIGLFMPVLYDTGDPSTSRIVQMNLVVCKK